MLTSTFDPSTFQMIGFVVIVWILTIFIGRRFLRKWHGEELADVAPFMLTTVEGGSVTLPLYTAIVGMEYAVNTVTFDIAGAILAFVVIPILVARMSSSGVGRRGIFLQIIRNPFVLAVFFGVDRKSTRLNSSHVAISYAVFCLKKITTRPCTAV